MSGKRQDYITWDEYFMAVAKLAGMRSKDPNTQVGACIVSADNKREGETLSTKYVYTVHSELNAILNYRGGSLEGAKIYVSLFPCNECAKAIIQSGIKTIIYDSDKYHDTDTTIASRKMLDAAGVAYYRYEATDREIVITV